MQPAVWDLGSQSAGYEWHCLLGFRTA